MNNLISLIKLDLKLLVKYNLLIISIILSVIYIIIFKIFQINEYYPLVAFIIFSDPAMMGFIFVGVMVLFEKGQHTIHALSVCPLKMEHYLWSKAISLTVMALPICFSIVFSAYGLELNYFAFMLAVILSSILFVLLGFIGVARVHSFNQFIIIIPLFFIPAIIPVLDLFNLWFHPFFYIIPSHACLLLFKASFTEISYFEWIYSLAYITAWLIGSRYFAIKSYRKYLLV